MSRSVLGVICFILRMATFIDAVGTPRPTDPAHTVTLGFLQIYNDADNQWTPETADTFASYDLDAIELKIAVELAVQDVNNNVYEELLGRKILEGYSLEIDSRNTYYERNMAYHTAQIMIDPAHNPAPPPIILGLAGFAEADGVLAATQPYQTPVISPFVSTPSLSATYPNYQRLCATDQIEMWALMALCNSFNWKKVVAIVSEQHDAIFALFTVTISFHHLCDSFGQLAEVFAAFVLAVQ